MTQRRRPRTVLALGSLLTVGALLTACTGDPEPGPTPTSRTATEPGDESGAPAPSAGTPGSTPESTAEGTPGPDTRRTTEGLNSEGAWSYGAAPEVQTQLRVGT